jgi:hypothetical protein
VKLTVDFKFRHVREAACNGETRHFALFGDIERREGRPVRQKDIGNEQVNFTRFENLSRIIDTSRRANVIFSSSSNRMSTEETSASSSSNKTCFIG